jgi:putative spermidine/putrescine transport system permease protein
MARRIDADALSFGLAIGGLASIAVVFLIAPTLILLITSFTDSESLKFPPSGYSFRWYAALLDAHQLLDAAWNSLVVAVWTTVLSVILGVTAALAIGRSRAPWAKALDSLFMSPLLLPALAFGFGALIYFNSIGLAQSMIGLIFGHTAVCVPFVLRNSIAALSQLNPAMQEASESLGAGSLYTFRRVTLPLIAPGVGAGSFIAFMSSFDNVPVSLFLSDARTQMLPIHLWEIIETNLDVRTAAASGVIVVATLVLMILAERFAGLTKQLR